METKFKIGETVFVDWPHEFWRGLGIITLLLPTPNSIKVTYFVKIIDKDHIGRFEERELKKVSPGAILKYKLTGKFEL
jgi:hypothetical protein